MKPDRIASSLHNVLLEVHQHPFPHVPNPPKCKKRASVALILRVRPTYDHWPDTDATTAAPPNPPDGPLTVQQRLDAFFSQPWVRHGDPEVLFIKRASRAGDRWTGHVALPGGKRDPEDVDDQAAAVREAAEEIGFDLTTEDSIHVGNLPERVVTTSWGSVPLMVLCPFVFLTTRYDPPPLKLQPSEVASTHWVSLRALLSPALRTKEYVDVSDRFAKQSTFVPRLVYRSMVGLMQFSAIRLIPTESVYCSSIPGFVPEETDRIPTSSVALHRWKTWCLSGQAASKDRNRPLLLWGLTLGILADFLDMLPPHNAVQLWEYPTFTALDLRLIVSLLTYRLRKRNLSRVQCGIRQPSETAADNTTVALPVTPQEERPMDQYQYQYQGQGQGQEHNRNEVGIGGLGVGRYYGPSSNGVAYAVGIMLSGYYDRLRVAIWVFLAWRLASGSLAAYLLMRFLRRRGWRMGTR